MLSPKTVRELFLLFFLFPQAGCSIFNWWNYRPHTQKHSADLLLHLTSTHTYSNQLSVTFTSGYEKYVIHIHLTPEKHLLVNNLSQHLSLLKSACFACILSRWVQDTEEKLLSTQKQKSTEVSSEDDNKIMGREQIRSLSSTIDLLRRLQVRLGEDAKWPKALF